MMGADMPVLKVRDVAKAFTLHAQDGIRLPVFDNLSFSLNPSECIALNGPSGIGKSTLMRMVYGNFHCPSGEILVKHGDAWIDIAKAHPHRILDVRRHTLGYVSQFLRVLPRVPTLDIVMEPALAQGIDKDEATQRAQQLLTRLRVPERLWSLSPMTFSGGEQQRVNLARCFSAHYPIMLLDEPTASLDAENRQTVIEIISEARIRGCAMIGIFHDQPARDVLCTRGIDLSLCAAKAA
jgi:alpha-D-ribose 1-methylphosphonate 5-triphosphate synthase subunit PhnL